MALPSADHVKELARNRVLEAKKKGKLHTLTPKLLRREIESELELEEGDLDSLELRNAVKEAIATTMADVGPNKAEDTQNDISSTKKSGKSTSKGNKRTANPATGGTPTKKPRVAKKKGDADVERKTKGKGKTTKQETSLPPDKNAAAGEDSGDDEAQTSTSKKLSISRRKAAPVPVEDAEDSAEEEAAKPKSHITKAEPAEVDVVMSEPTNEQPVMSQGIQEEGKAGYKSESELSVLIDEPPKKKRESKGKKDGSSTKKQSEKKSNTKNKKTETPSKDEETVKKLKSLVLACGIRKVWSKVFQGLDTSSQQIRVLKEILHDLGMTGRMSLEQAKAIKQKRELAQELQDVQEFEKAIMKSGRRSRGEEPHETNGVEEDEDEDEDEDPKPRRRKMNAAQSISAFLGDQSSEED